MTKQTMSNNKLYIAAAGSGKTRLLIEEAEEEMQHLPTNKKIAIVTFTINNQNNISERLIHDFKVIPSQIKVMGWYTFVLNYWIKPFKGDVIPELYDHHVGLLRVEGTSGLVKTGKNNYRHTTSKSNPRTYYMSPDRRIYSDKLSQMAQECFDKNFEVLPKRLSDIFSTIYIDEVQDLATYDWELIRLMAITQQVNLRMFGDPRQSIISTAKGAKNKKFLGRPDRYVENQVNKRRKTYIDIDDHTLSVSHRCVEDICVFTNRLLPDYPPTHSCNCDDCVGSRRQFPFEKGVFVIKEAFVDDYIAKYNPISLVWDKKHREGIRTRYVYNYGDSKGMEANATLIYLTKGLVDFIRRDGAELSDFTRKKFYVAVTRARFACALVVPNDFNGNRFNLPWWEG